MKSLVKSFLFLFCFVPVLGIAQIAPLPVDPNTVALWNFDTDVNDQVIDIGPTPLNGTAYTTEHVVIPEIDPSFNLARKFSSQSSFVDLGVVQGSKLDFTGWNEVSVEAIIHLTQSASSDHIIFSSENVRLMVVNNQLTAVVRQPGGLYGVVSDRTLSLNTTYRVGLHYKSQNLLLTINGRIDSSIRLDYGIQAPQFSSSRSSIGGDLFARYFPGYIDDVRVRNIVDIDIQGPGIELVEPSSFQVTTAKPHFLINLSDDLSGVDVNSIEVYLNGILQPGISRTETQISGLLDDELSTSFLNEVKIIVADNQGNINEKTFFFTYASILERQEYITDEHTLALWHMNDYSPGFLKDDSGHGRNGYGNAQQILTAEGVFGQGRHFIRGGEINFDSIRFDNLKFTFEAWFRPTSDNFGGEEILFYNGQMKIIRWNGGYIRVVLYTTRGEKNYISSDVLLPLNELHHLAVTWDGTKPNQNLRFFVDGLIRGEQNAVSDCDFDPIPKLGQIGSGYEGLMDEMRFSDAVRLTFSIPVFDNQVINFLNLKNGTSVNEAFPEFHATLNSATTINVSTVKILLNGVNEPVSENLVVTSTGIDGTFAQPLKVGLNNLEISFLDNQGNQRKKSQYFYFIKKDGGAEYSPTLATAGLWHFNETQTGHFEDASGNGNSFDITSFSPVPGVIGNGVRGEGSFSEKMPLNCRSYTIEAFLRVEESYDGFIQFYHLGNTSSSETVRLNPANGSIQIDIRNTNTLDVVVPQAVPVDSAYHHIAVVYDGSRAYSQVLLIVDGVVKRALDYHNSCDFSGTNTFALGQGGSFSFDEVRVSKEAKYSFNLQNELSDRPVLSSTNGTHFSTISSPDFQLYFSVTDSDGINASKTKVFLNGAEQTVSSVNKLNLDLTSDFTSSLVLNAGANIITIITQDMRGNDQVFNNTVFMFAQSPAAEYVSDTETVFLYHMNETSGPFIDSASSGNDIPDGGWSRSAGVFNGGANNYSIGGGYNYGDLPSGTGWTYETWLRGGHDTHLFYGGNLQIKTNSYSLQFYVNGQTFTQTENIVNDELYHHYAIVYDPNHPYANVYMLIDGKVVYSAKTSIDLSPGNLYGGFAYSLLGADMDEARFSKIPRYELVSSQE